MPDLAGRVAVVTGSSSGIGRAIALELAACGADVVVHGRSADKAAAVAEEIRRLRVGADVLLANLVDPAAQDQLAADAWQWRGRVDVWINAAGADTLTGEAAAWSFERKLEELWRVDVVATLRLSRDVGRRMKAQGHGVILNIGWDQAEHGMAGDSGELFATTKGAIHCGSRSLALSLAPEVRVNCIAPGWIKTSWGEQASEYWQQRAKRESQMGRWGTPQDVARAARFLVSPDAGFISGWVLPVNGGFKES